MAAPKVMLVSDLDHTMVAHDEPDHNSLRSFNALWKDHFAGNSELVFSTGRSYALYEELRKFAPMLSPDVLVCSVGTEIYHFPMKDGGDAGQAVDDLEWIEHLKPGWDRARIQSLAAGFPELKPQADSEQRTFKLSYTVGESDDIDEVCTRLQAALKGADCPAKVIHSAGVDVDILNERAGKGMALAFLLKKMAAAGREAEEVLVCGDSGNDIELFQVEGVKGCVVANAHPELRRFVTAKDSSLVFQASKNCAGGIVEAMNHFKLGSTPDCL